MLDVPLLVEAGTGDNWDEATDLASVCFLRFREWIHDGFVGEPAVDLFTQLVDALTLQRRKTLHADELGMGGELAPNRQQRILGGAAFQFVRFGEQDMYWHAGGDAQPSICLSVRQWVPDIHQHHQAPQAFPVLQVALRLLIPLF